MTKLLLIGLPSMFLRDLLMMLEFEGFEIFMAHQEDEGIQLVQNHHPDLIIYDAVKPLMNSKVVQLALNLDTQTAIIPIMMLANSTEHNMSGVYTVLKPFTIQELLHRIKTILSS